MIDYKMMYLKLFNSISDAIEEITRQNYGIAASLLKKAQQVTEESFMNTEDEG